MTDESEDECPKKGKAYIQWMVAITANTTLLTHGIQAGWVAPMISILQSEDSPAGRPLTNNEISWIAGSISLAACFGVSLFAYIVTVLGRQKAIVIIAIMQALCWVIKICSSSAISLILARVFAGIAGGGCYNTIPVYVREIAQDNLRGILGSFLVLLQNTGFLIMFSIGVYLDYYIILWTVVWIPIITAVLMLFAPESPPYLVKKGLIDQATTTLARLRGLDIKDKHIQREIEYMKNQEDNYKSMPNISYLNIWQHKVWRIASFLNLILMTMRDISGNFAILTYTPDILAASGVTVKPELQMISFPVVMIIASMVSMCFVEKFGRKNLLTAALMIGCLSLVILATIMLIQKQGGQAPAWIPVMSIIAYFIAYAGGISPMPYIIMAEMFNFQIRAKVIGVLVTYGWFVTFLQLVTFTSISNCLGRHNVFYCYAGVNLLGAIVTYKFLPETKGKTAEEIEADLKGGNNRII